MDLGWLVWAVICGVDVGVVERTGRCGDAVVSMSAGRVDGLVGM
jgi:hypothetical protein